MSTAGNICRMAADLVDGPRAETHGDALEVFADVAAFWNTYLADRLPSGRCLTARDVALLMVLFKVARTRHGRHNPDDYTDIAGYGAHAGAIADLMAGVE